MAVNIYTKEKEINGKKYVAQFNGVSAALDAVDTTYIDGTTTTSMKKMSKYILENVIVEPKGLTVDDFSSMDELADVIAFGRDVMNGEFRPAENKGATKAKG